MGETDSAQEQKAEGDGTGSRVCRAKFVSFGLGEGALLAPRPEKETRAVGRPFWGLFIGDPGVPARWGDLVWEWEGACGSALN